MVRRKLTFGDLIRRKAPNKELVELKDKWMAPGKPFHDIGRYIVPALTALVEEGEAWKLEAENYFLFKT